MPAKPDQFNDFLPGPRGGRVSLGWKVWQGDQSDGSRPPEPKAESGQCCVYNQTCERFLSVEVEAADFSVSGLETRLQIFSPSEGKALWLVPFRGIAPTSVRMPLDLLYLDRECVVIEAVESFPIFRVSGSSRPAASVLVLPPQSIASTGTRAGDQLIFRPPAEMKLVLEQLAKMKAEGQLGHESGQLSGPGSGPGPRQVLPWKDLTRPDLSRPEPPPVAPDSPLATGSHVSPFEIAPVPSDQTPFEPSAQPAPEPTPQPAQENPESWPKKKKSWLERFLSTEPDDKRYALRESIPGLTAFFFTGGTPIPHGIRDVSETGLYVLTEERWYPGTVIRITLTDQRQPTAERSFTVNAMVMRWGNDGVGLHFIFQDKKDRKRSNLSSDERAMGVADAASFKKYLEILRGARS
jgi:hypothetical protein